MESTPQQVRRDFDSICRQFRLGLITPEEACVKLLHCGIESDRAVEYLNLLPSELRAALPEFLSGLPVADDVGQSPGDRGSYLHLGTPRPAKRWDLRHRAPNGEAWWQSRLGSGLDVP